MYAVRVDTSSGFELCPADVCQIDDKMCPVGAESANAKAHRFEIGSAVDEALVSGYSRVCDDMGLDIVAFEYIVDSLGRSYTYDINTNTNYNREAEMRAASVRGMDEIARYLALELADVLND